MTLNTRMREYAVGASRVCLLLSAACVSHEPISGSLSNRLSDGLGKVIQMFFV